MEKKFKRLLGLILVMVMLCFGAVFLTGCGDDYESDYDDTEYDSDYDSGSDYDGGDSGDSNFEDYDYNNNNSIEDSEFQDAANDYMDENGY